MSESPGANTPDPSPPGTTKADTNNPPLRIDHRELVTLFLRGRGVACPACGYPLTDLPRGVCPECGLSLVLRLALTKPKQGVYITGLIGLGVGIGFHGVLLLYFAYMTWYTGSMGGPDLRDMIPMFIALAIELPCIVIWARSWGFFQRRSGLVGVTLAMACWVISLGLAILFLAMAG